MILTWHGQSAVKLQAATGTILIDPQTDASGLQRTRVTTDLLLLGLPEEHKTGAPEGTFVVERPGEYERKELFVYSIPAAGEQMSSGDAGTIFLVQGEQMRIGHLGFLKGPLTEVQKEFFDEVDVLCIPVGGGSVLGPKAAADLVSALEPRIVIPMHYKMKGSTEKLGDATPFLKEVGAKETEEAERLNIKKKDLPQEETRFVLLKPNAKR
jgi:L-ascorbate metabolism protein UlaG (beta-lactamase superfamily)